MRGSTTRREALLSSAALLAASSAAPRIGAASLAADEPSHDPSYSVIPSRAELFKPLGDAAGKSRGNPRMLDDCAYAVLTNSDNQSAIDQVIRAASVFVDKVSSTAARTIDWREYGYPAARAFGR